MEKNSDELDFEAAAQCRNQLIAIFRELVFHTGVENAPNNDLVAIISAPHTGGCMRARTS